MYKVPIDAPDFIIFLKTILMLNVVGNLNKNYYGLYVCLRTPFKDGRGKEQN